MEDVQIKLSALWVMLMLTYLLGDVMRIFAGDFEPGKISGMDASQAMWVLIAAIMLVPIMMVGLTLILPFPAGRWVCIVVSILIALFNLVGLPYKGVYDNFLIVVSLILNALIVWYAWTWAT
ncbi:MAG: DUF6326 family protein [Anaerolineae bacterium]|nr:DUF6326 family protein [Anaerolineae bacterium]MCO5205218.1 DUF6326 family protein [Anaerolineae bacterium]